MIPRTLPSMAPRLVMAVLAQVCNATNKVKRIPRGLVFTRDTVCSANHCNM